MSFHQRLLGVELGHFAIVRTISVARASVMIVVVVVRIRSRPLVVASASRSVSPRTGTGGSCGAVDIVLHQRLASLILLVVAGASASAARRILVRTVFATQHEDSARNEENGDEDAADCDANQNLCLHASACLLALLNRLGCKASNTTIC